MGEVTAKKIVEGSPYASIDDLAKVGVSAKTIDGIRPLVIVSKPRGVKPVPPQDKPAMTPKPATQAAAESKVNLNTATLKELETLPGIGPSIGQQIIDARPLKKIEDLEKIKGLGKTKIAAIKDLVVFSDAAATTSKVVAPRGSSKSALDKGESAKKKTATTSPAAGKHVNINTASKADLDALPGIGPVKAQAILDARPFKSKEDIMKVKGIKQVEFSKIKDIITVD